MVLAIEFVLMLVRVGGSWQRLLFCPSLFSVATGDKRSSQWDGAKKRKWKNTGICDSWVWSDLSASYGFV
jgi:hypothetical protein